MKCGYWILHSNQNNRLYNLSNYWIYTAVSSRRLDTAHFPSPFSSALLHAICYFTLLICFLYFIPEITICDMPYAEITTVCFLIMSFPLGKKQYRT